MLRAVIDANGFVNALIRPSGPPGQIITRFLDDQSFELIMSASILVELRRCLGYPKVKKCLLATPEALGLWVDGLALNAVIVEALQVVQAIPDDPDDEKYLAAALEGRADYIVSGDQHLLSLIEFQGKRIITPRAFLVLLDNV